MAQLRLLASEAEQAAADGAAALRDETRRAARDQGLMRAELASAYQQIEVRRRRGIQSFEVFCWRPPTSTSR